MKWSIGKKIVSGYLLAVVLLAGLGIMAHFNSAKLVSSVDWQEHTREVLGRIDAINYDIAESEALQHAYLYTRDSVYREAYTQYVKKVGNEVNSLKNLISLYPVQITRIEAIESAIKTKIAAMNQAVEMNQAGDLNEAKGKELVGRGYELATEIRTRLGEMRSDEVTRLAERTVQAEASLRQADRLMTYGLPLAAVILLVAGVFIARGISVPLGQITRAAEQIAAGNPEITLPPAKGHDEVSRLAHSFTKMSGVLTDVAEVNAMIAQGDLSAVVKPQSTADKFGLAHQEMIAKLSHLVGAVQRAGLQVNSSATEIAATSKQQHATATEIAATTTEIGATSREIAATSKELVRTVGQVNKVAEDTAHLATNGQSGLLRMESTMRQIMDASAGISSKLAVLNEKAANINTVVTTITKVADQTNLLSLNAAIEAEKAGEYGLGFSVVATEIRRLADQTAIATYDIEQMVKEMQSAVSAGVMGMDKFSEEVRRGVEEVRQVGTQLTQIIHQVQTLTPQFEAVNEGMQSQSTGAQQITDALTQLSEAAQQTAESLRSSGVAIDQLNSAARELQSGVSRFKLKS